MLEEKDLQAIAEMMQGMESRIDQKMGAMESRIDQKIEKQKQDIMSETKGLLAQQKQDIMSETKGLLAQQKQEIKTELRQELMQDMRVLLDTEVTTRFNLLAEGQQAILDSITPKSEIEELRNEVSVLKLAIRTMNQDIAELKKAQ